MCALLRYRYMYSDSCSAHRAQYMVACNTSLCMCALVAVVRSWNTLCLHVSSILDGMYMNVMKTRPALRPKK